MTRTLQPVPVLLASNASAVCDASPLIMLDYLGYLPALRAMRGTIIIPEEVAHEIGRQPGKPASSVVEARLVTVMRAPHELVQRVSAGPPAIDPGETEAIALALAERITLIIDEQKGRLRARRLGVRISGTIGELVAMHSLGFASAYSERSFEMDLQMLRDAGMRLSEKLRTRILETFGNMT